MINNLQFKNDLRVFRLSTLLLMPAAFNSALSEAL